MHPIIESYLIEAEQEVNCRQAALLSVKEMFDEMPGLKQAHLDDYNEVVAELEPWSEEYELIVLGKTKGAE